MGRKKFFAMRDAYRFGAAYKKEEDRTGFNGFNPTDLNSLTAKDFSNTVCGEFDDN